jgi:hypothetical protein
MVNFIDSAPVRTAKTQYRKIETNILRKGIARLSPNFHIHMPMSDLYILLQENMWMDPGNINHPQTHECGNWD